MQELMTISISTHVLLLLTMILTTIIILFLFLTRNDYVKLTKTHERGSLIYFLFLSMFAFTGLLAFTVIKFAISFRVIVMLLALFYMITTSVKLHIKFKRSRIYDKSSQKEFILYARKKYMIDTFLLILIGFLSYAVHF